MRGLTPPHDGQVALALDDRAMMRKRSGAGRSRSTVKPDGTSENNDFGSRMDHGKGQVSRSYRHSSRIIHQAAPKMRKNLCRQHTCRGMRA
jgi:hypothetical protein